MKRTPVHPINPFIRNGVVADFYLSLVRKGRYVMFRRLLEHVLHTQVMMIAPLPQRLYLPHPFGVIVGQNCKLAEDVTLMQWSLLGPNNPWFQGTSEEILHPTLEEGAYVSSGAAVLGAITIGAWSVIGVNAVVTEDVPPFSTVFGNNRILRSTDGGAEPVKRYLAAKGRALPADKAVRS
jgi:serine acetyltransferase